LETVFENLDVSTSFGLTIIEPALVKPLRQAFVFINTETDSYESALEDLKRIEGVDEVHPSRGAYDIIAKVSGESLENLRELIFRRIRNVGNVKSTLTLMVIPPKELVKSP
jgi:DNA-binding Lrp family transcriptional regulator